jgi:hypothetical protein
MATTIDLLEIRSIALAAAVDPRSVAREIREPGSVTKAAGVRIRRELERRGYRSGDPLAISYAGRLRA